MGMSIGLRSRQRCREASKSPCGRAPQPRPFLERPLRSLLDLKIGTVLRAYAVYVGISLVLGVIGLVVVLAIWNHGEGASLARGGSISWEAGAGEEISPADYRAIAKGARLQAVRSRFGEPATTGSNPFDAVSGDVQTCLGYRSTASDSRLYLLCFERGRLIDKQPF